MSSLPKSSFLLDTGPLSVLCSFPLTGPLYIYTILNHADLVLSESVADEIRLATRGKVARTMLPLMHTDRISIAPMPGILKILDVSYGQDLGLGERGTIKTALAFELPLVLDDMKAFVAACRFGLHPMVFQDFIVRLAREHGLPKESAVEIVTATSRQFPAMFLAHTLDILR